MDISLTIELEKKLLSALMLDEGEAIPEIADILTVEDFYRPEHKFVYEALLNLSDKGEAINFLVVESELERMQLLKRITHSYLFGLVNLEYTTARAEYYAKELKKMSTLRQLAQLGREMTDEAENERHTPEEIMAYAEEKLSATTATKDKNVEKLVDIAMRTVEDLGTQHTRESTDLPTGIFTLDRVIGGLKKSDLIILAARPSMGKTALALNIATAAARKGNVLIFSLEMSKRQLSERILSSISRIPATRIQRADLSEDEWDKLMSAVEETEALKMHVDDTGGLSLFAIKQTARRVKREEGLDLIVVDYIQLMQGSKEYRGNRVQEVSELSRGLKALARELDVPILALSQLSRAVELRAEKKPQLSDLRESGSIEQDADIVMFLYREEYYDRDNEDAQNLAEVIIAKNRNGAIGSVRLSFQKEILLFDMLTRRDTNGD